MNTSVRHSPFQLYFNRVEKISGPGFKNVTQILPASMHHLKQRHIQDYNISA